MAAHTNVCVIGLGSMGMGAARACLQAGLNTWALTSIPTTVAHCWRGAKGAGPSAVPFAAELDAVVLLVVNAAQCGDPVRRERPRRPSEAGHRRDGVVHHRLRRCSGHCRGAGGVPAIDARRAGIGRRRGGRRRHDGDGLRSDAALPDSRRCWTPGRQSLPHRERHWSGSTVKIIHQLLAGVHIAVAAEAMALPPAPGSHWRRCMTWSPTRRVIRMFENRMQHVLDGDYSPKSAVDIFVKDLGLVNDTARARPSRCRSLPPR